MEFMSRATSKGFKLSKPLFPEAYDFILDNGIRALKIQVKASATKKPIKSAPEALCWIVSMYKGHLSKTLYTYKDCDFFLVHLYVENIWYVIPRQEAKTKLTMYPYVETCRLYKYKEAWDLLLTSERPTIETEKCLSQLA